MNENHIDHPVLDEIAALKTQFQRIKSETDDFIVNLKRASKEGAAEAKELVEAAKENWHSIVNAFEASPMARFFGGEKKLSARASSKKRKTKAHAPVAKQKKSKPLKKKASKKAAKKMNRR